MLAELSFLKDAAIVMERWLWSILGANHGARNAAVEKAVRTQLAVENHLPSKSLTNTPNVAARDSRCSRLGGYLPLRQFWMVCRLTRMRLANAVIEMPLTCMIRLRRVGNW